MNDALLCNFTELISINTGLHIRKQDQENLCEKIYARMKLLKISVPSEYYQLLKYCNYYNSSQKQSTCNYNKQIKESEREWKELILLLTVGETFFFRDQGQIALLKNRLLPEIIEYKQSLAIANKSKPSIRIWSAGCSTGEEAYSLAILLNEVIGDCSQWKISILGTDINHESIEKAKRGIYGSWSFRMVKPELQKRYFNQCNNYWEVSLPIRNMVTFCFGNLQDKFPNYTSNIHDMDIIICRNVFIYFDFDTISKIIKKFHNTLRPGGYLITGHTEIHSQNLSGLQSKVFPESLAYQRIESIELKTNSTEIKNKSKAKNVFTQTKSDCESITSQALLQKVETLIRDGNYKIATREAKQVIKQQPDNFDAYCITAQNLANLGECEQAAYYCEAAINANSLSVKPYLLLSQIFEEQGSLEKAKNLLKKVIYLAPLSIAAYIELGYIYTKEGDHKKAKKMYNTAYELLKKLPECDVVEHYELTTSELILHVESLLKQHA